jgi:eukaryotic-like serine/threonine-protein kinase
MDPSSHYEELVTGNLEAARTAYELWAQTYPSDPLPPFVLANIYRIFGEYDKALTAAQESLKLRPGNTSPYGRLAEAYRVLNRPDKVRATAREAQAHNLDGPFIHVSLYQADFLQHDSAGMERESVWLMGKPGWEEMILDLESDTAAYSGDFTRARELTGRIVDSARRSNQKEMVGLYKAGAAVREAMVGNVALANQDAKAALALADGSFADAFSALALSLAGDSAQAERLADDLRKRFPEDTFVQLYFVPQIRGAVALRSGNAGKALEALAAAPYEFGFYVAYLRGEAYLAARKGSSAQGEFQKILDHPGVVVNDLIGALAHLGMGRAYALAGDSAKAKTAYQDFFNLWKNADADIPILIQAKAEYANLN